MAKNAKKYSDDKSGVVFKFQNGQKVKAGPAGVIGVVITQSRHTAGEDTYGVLFKRQTGMWTNQVFDESEIEPL